jgi:hypothetical protein
MDMSHHYLRDKKSTENVNLLEQIQEYERQRFNRLKIHCKLRPPLSSGRLLVKKNDVVGQVVSPGN